MHELRKDLSVPAAPPQSQSWRLSNTARRVEAECCLAATDVRHQVGGFAKIRSFISHSNTEGHHAPTFRLANRLRVSQQQSRTQRKPPEALLLLRSVAASCSLFSHPDKATHIQYRKGFKYRDQEGMKKKVTYSLVTHTQL